MGNKVNGVLNPSKCWRCDKESCPFRCQNCQNKFCTNCFRLNPRQIPNVCLRCAMCGIKEQPPTYPELMKLPNKDLLWILTCSNYNVQGLKEKEEIVKEIIKHFNIYYNIQNSTNISSNFTTSMDIDRDSPRPTSSSNEPEVRPEASSTQPSSSQNAFPDRIDPPSYSDHMQKQYVNNQPSPSPEVPEERQEEKKIPTWNPPKERFVSLDDIPSVECVELLSNKQLLWLLSDNCVKKDCLEKAEIISKVKQLWVSHSDNKKRKELRDQISDDIRREDKEFLDKFECKICMDAEIDCVLLECGHAVMCIECAKKVKECPICSQGITRRVRMFRA